jgi:hypothetical protein
MVKYKFLFAVLVVALFLIPFTSSASAGDYNRQAFVQRSYAPAVQVQAVQDCYGGYVQQFQAVQQYQQVQVQAVQQYQVQRVQAVVEYAAPVVQRVQAVYSAPVVQRVQKVQAVQYSTSPQRIRVEERRGLFGRVRSRTTTITN